MKSRPVDVVEDGKYYINLLTSIHGDKPFEIRFVPNSNHRGFGSTSILRYGDYIYRAKLIKGEGVDKKAQWCRFNAEEFGRAIIDEFMNVSDYGVGCNVLFTVNSPNFDIMNTCVTSDEHIKDGGSINAQFIDIDAPKQIRKDKESLRQFKKQVAQSIKSFSVQPSGVIETKNGYHVYWFVSDGKPELFRHVQMQLVQELGGDKNCINESRLLRLPYFMHVKDPKEPFPVTIKVWQPEVSYSQKYLKDNLSELTDETLEKLIKKSESSQQTNMSSTRKDAVLELVFERINPVGGNEDKIITQCCMPDHNDKKPSAWIDKNYMFYHCQGCGTHLPLEELARELNWHDVLDEINRYDIDLDQELNKVKSNARSVKELIKDVSEQEQQQIENIAESVIGDFKNAYNQNINDRHVQYIFDIVTLLVKASEQEKPTLIPLEMGGGKSTIIKVFLQQMLRDSNDYGAVVVVDRIEDAKKLAEEINDYFGSDQHALALYGFDEDDCLDNLYENAKNNSCPVFATNFKYKCNHIQRCRYFQQGEIQKQYPVLIVTKKRISLDFGKIGKYKFFGEHDEKQRKLLLFDEKPSIVSIRELNHKQFDRYNDLIQSKMEKSETPEALKEFNKAVEYVESHFYDAEKRELFEAIDKDFYFSDAFQTEFRKQFPDYTREIFEYPNTLQNIIRNGGHKDVTSKGVKLITNVYQDYADISGFKTFIFDGTADMDLEYNHDKYRLINFEPIRTYEGLEINICDTISASRTSLSDSDKVKAFCDDVITICEQHPTSKVYIPTFMSNEDEIADYLKDYIQRGQVLLAHYGATKGTNKFKECDIVAICGILHKNENHYIAKAKAIYEQCGELLDDIDCTKYDNVRRFNDNRIEAVKLLDMLAEYSQEIKRSNQRNNAENVAGKVYVFHNDKLLLEQIGLKFPNCTISEWYPQNMIETAIVTKGNNPKQMAFIDYINECEKHEIWFDEIREYLDMPTKGFSKLINNDTIQDFIKSKGYVEIKDGKRKKLVKS
ncbi:MAG: hypothetical protein NAG76_02455 [Candidatus Pristimantibacillus lignocellulolyticus]|uniref:Uncharacterized protein n=1 Tax=Candidatus Pristimantibacillus lignocellulolyticus TaxID=2994561 RepID=A0A9J6ZG32_9BACL|nr:MAG: hypothetical protein NAG76_02455 [Candidatus Pristimantibacillus lignocellulolyticus]